MYMGYFDSQNFDFSHFPDVGLNKQMSGVLERAKTYKLPLDPYAGGTLFKAELDVSKEYATLLSFMGNQVVTKKLIHAVSDNTYENLLKSARATMANLTGGASAITRAELARIVVAAFNLEAKVSAVLKNDYAAEATANSSLWTYESIILRELGIVAPNTSFDPTRNASRFEALLILNNTMDILTCYKRNCSTLDVVKGVY